MSGPGRGAGPRYRDELSAPADAPGPAKTAISAAVTMHFLPLMSGAGDSVGPDAVAVVCRVLLDNVDGPWQRVLVRCRSELVRARFEPRGAASVGAPQPWPLVRVVAVVVDVPVRAAGVPDGGVQCGTELAVERLGGAAVDLDLLRSRALELAQRGDHMAHAALDRVDD